MLRTQKSVQRRHFSHLPGSYGYETLQGVQWDSLGVGAVEIGHIIAPDHRRHCQEAPKRFLVTPAAFPCFCAAFLRRGEVWGYMCLLQTLSRGWGALKDKKHAGGF